ncbi:RNA-directed DNA polymerase, eukaryota [Tanacetum coccineum]|uniref:RNA-directed DNA polymerase, eukaryota n=1 Tax=Tanacetum coccineum TaxID=301880 RepID=A0ABQ5GYP4_9ASTR
MKLDNHIQDSVNSIPDLNDPIIQNTTMSQEDVELEALISSFQRISENVKKEVYSKVDKKKKPKSKKKKLMVGSGSVLHVPASHEVSREECRDESVLENIGAQIGYTFKLDACRNTTSSKGASGGIITMWDTRLFSSVSVIDSRNFLGVIGSWVGISHKIGLLNVYAPQSSVLKVQLWSAVENLIRSNDAVWIIFGDFNVVRCQNERFGSSFDINEASAFNDFISRVGLFDFPLGGRRFTRFEKNGGKASKLDRFLVSPSFFDCWKDTSVSVLCRTLSDHCPLLHKVNSPNFGPKPYRVFDKWLGVVRLPSLLTWCLKLN